MLNTQPAVLFEQTFVGAKARIFPQFFMYVEDDDNDDDDDDDNNNNNNNNNNSCFYCLASKKRLGLITLYIT